MTYVDEIITKKHPLVTSFFTEAREMTDMLDSIVPYVRLPLNGKCFIDDKELSKRLSLHRRTLQNFRNDNVIPYYKIGGKVIYDEAEIELWLNSNFHPKY